LGRYLEQFQRFRASVVGRIFVKRLILIGIISPLFVGVLWWAAALSSQSSFEMEKGGWFNQTPFSRAPHVH